MYSAETETIGLEALELAGDAIDIPVGKYQEATERYEAVGKWLSAEDSALAVYEPGVYPQGSFALGTAIRPVGEGEYDVDAVCLLGNAPAGITQQELKRIVGGRLKESGSRYRDMIEPTAGGRRCWTIRYADPSKFHLDILPAIPDTVAWLVSAGVPHEYAKDAIRITDRKTWDASGDWPRSNPKGYGLWFRQQMVVNLTEARNLMAKSTGRDVESIRDYEVRTPLQRSVQILKKHRDIHLGDDEDKPISIIITTLSAQAYDNEADLRESLLGIIERMHDGIVKAENGWWVRNPVNPLENFADKWNETPRKRTVFQDWLGQVETDLLEIAEETREDRVFERIEKSFGRDTATRVTEGLIDRAESNRGDGLRSVIGPRREKRVREEPAIVSGKEGPRPWAQ